MEAIKEKKSTKAFVKLGFTHLETAEIVSNLDKLLANYHIHYQKLRSYHWNVEGPDFFELHEKFEELYNEVKVNIDEVAERIRVFGKTPTSTLIAYLEISEIKETHTALNAYQMVKDILNDFEILLSLMINVTDAANKIGDAGTIDMVNTFIRKMEKTHWMFTAWLKNQDGPKMI